MWCLLNLLLYYHLRPTEANRGRRGQRPRIRGDHWTVVIPGNVICPKICLSETHRALSVNLAIDLQTVTLGPEVISKDSTDFRAYDYRCTY